MNNEVSPSPFLPDVVIPTPQAAASMQTPMMQSAPLQTQTGTPTAQPQQFIAQPVSQVPPPVEQFYRPPADSPAPLPMGSLANGNAAPRDPIEQAAQASGMASSSATPSAQTQAAFDDEINNWADKKTISGITFFYNVIDEETKQALKHAPRDLATALGIPYESARTGTDATGKEIQLTEEQENIQENMGNQIQQRVINNALRSWSAPRRCEPENIAKLLPHIRRELSEAIISLSLNGVTEARFRLGLAALPQEK